MSKRSNKKFFGTVSSSRDKPDLLPAKGGNTNKFTVLDMDDETYEEPTTPIKKEEPVIPSNKGPKALEPVVIKKLVEDKLEKNTHEKIFKPEKIKHLEGNDGWKMAKPKYKKELEKETDDFEDRSVNKQLYIDNDEKGGDVLGNNLYLHSPWTVWTHKSDCNVWTEDSYTNIYVINSLGSFHRFFNNFHLLDKIKNQLFIMRNKIKPIWEDNENRNGGICSIKIDCFNRQGKIDMGTNVMVCICMLVMNETFLPSNDEINGISYSIKNKSVLIKLWCKNYTHDIIQKLPISYFNKLDTVLRNMDKHSFGRSSDKHSFGRKPENKISIRYTPIKPEYDVE